MNRAKFARTGSFRQTIVPSGTAPTPSALAPHPLSGGGLVALVPVAEVCAIGGTPHATSTATPGACAPRTPRTRGSQPDRCTYGQRGIPLPRARRASPAASEDAPRDDLGATLAGTVDAPPGRCPASRRAKIVRDDYKIRHPPASEPLTASTSPALSQTAALPGLRDKPRQTSASLMATIRIATLSNSHPLSTVRWRPLTGRYTRGRSLAQFRV